MAREFGESVAFSCIYADNLNKLAQLLRNCGRREVSVFAEFRALLKPCNYNDVKAKQKQLDGFFKRVERGVSGRTIPINCIVLARDLELKAYWMLNHIRKKEWLPEGFFNGYYDNDRKRVEGRKGNRLKMLLTSQTFAIMSGVATDEQIKRIIANIDKYLFDKNIGGYRLNTDFSKEQHNLGRAFSFVYGDKENGAVFSHMVVMYAYALFIRGFVEEASKVLKSLYKLAIRSEKSRIYPCLPEYFNLEGCGMYSYLTGSASWFLFVCQNLNF